MATITPRHSTTWGWCSYWQQSLLLKIGAFFALLSIAVCTYLITASNLSGQLTGVSKAIEQAGTERMRIYKIASLLERSPLSDGDRGAIREEMNRFERVVEGLRSGTPLHGSVVGKDLLVSAQLDALQGRWSVQLKPALEEVLAGDVASTVVQAYLQQVDDYVAEWDHLIRLIEEESATRLRTLRPIYVRPAERVNWL